MNIPSIYDFGSSNGCPQERMLACPNESSLHTPSRLPVYLYCGAKIRYSKEGREKAMLFAPSESQMRQVLVTVLKRDMRNLWQTKLVDCFRTFPFGYFLELGYGVSHLQARRLKEKERTKHSYEKRDSITTNKRTDKNELDKS